MRLELKLHPCKFSKLLDTDVSNAVNMGELLAVQRGENLPRTAQGGNELVGQADGQKAIQVTVGKGKDLCISFESETANPDSIIRLDYSFSHDVLLCQHELN